ncbi:MAG: hypothetical protein K2X25_02580 [Caulobacteraceae bacterium]|nr:hypothetical protein [Caulobacteraceae bacterium]
MANTQKPAQGWDAQAIQKIANAYYGGYGNMFEAHDWPERSTKIMPAVQSRVVEAYGSIRDFEEAHPPGDGMFPMEAIKADPPNVWLTSFYGFRPEEWGFLGFSDPKMHASFINRSKPGVLVVVYGGPKAKPEERGRVIGIQQCSHQSGTARQFMAPAAWAQKEQDPERDRRWDHAVKATRAWRVTPETQVAVATFAPDTYTPGRGQAIGSWGMPLSRAEALNILKFDLQECSVYGENSIIGSFPGTAKQVFAPSKAGPVSQTPFLTQESEGPKHLYILALKGDTDAFLGDAADGKLIVKAGFSKSPKTRCDDHNRALPKECAFGWEILHCGVSAGHLPYPSSGHAKAGERTMQEVLCTLGGRSLGGEFFLAERELIAAAWEKGNQAARDHKT